MLLQELNDFAWLEDGSRAHSSRDLNLPHSDELRFKLWLPVFEQHGDDFLEVFLNLVRVGTLRMSPRPPGNVTDEQAGIGVSFDHYVVCFHKGSPILIVRKQHRTTRILAP
jgi:hypothetical protein